MARIQFRRDSAANWELHNPILADGEIGINKDTKQFKLGDGLTTWKDLEYSSSAGISNTTEAPIISIPTTVNELTTVDITISNYDDTLYYNVFTELGSVDVSTHPFKLHIPDISNNISFDVMVMVSEIGKAASVTYKTITALPVALTNDDVYSYATTDHILYRETQDTLEEDWSKLTISANGSDLKLDIDTSTLSELTVVGAQKADKFIVKKSDNSFAILDNTATGTIKYAPTTNYYEVIDTLDITSIPGYAPGNSHAIDTGEGYILKLSCEVANYLTIHVINKNTGNTMFSDVYYVPTLLVPTVRKCQYKDGFLVYLRNSFTCIDVFNRKIVGSGTVHATNNFYFDGKTIYTMATFNPSSQNLQTFSPFSFTLIAPTQFNSSQVSFVFGLGNNKWSMTPNGIFSFGGGTLLNALSHLTLSKLSSNLFTEEYSGFFHTSQKECIWYNSVTQSFYSLYHTLNESATVTPEMLQNEPLLIQERVLYVGAGITNMFADVDTRLIYFIDRPTNTLKVIDFEFNQLASVNLPIPSSNYNYSSPRFMYTTSDGILTAIVNINDTGNCITFKTDTAGRRYAATNISITSLNLSDSITEVYIHPFERLKLNTYKNSKVESSTFNYITGDGTLTYIDRKGITSDNIYAVDATGAKEKIAITSEVTTNVTFNSTLPVTTPLASKGSGLGCVEMPNGMLYRPSGNGIAKTDKKNVQTIFNTPKSNGTYSLANFSNGSNIAKLSDTKILVVASYSGYEMFEYSIFDIVTETFTFSNYKTVYSSATQGYAICASDGEFGYIFYNEGVTTGGEYQCFKVDANGNIVENKYLTDISVNFTVSTTVKFINGKFQFYTSNSLVSILDYTTGVVTFPPKFIQNSMTVFYMDEEDNVYSTSMHTNSSWYYGYLYKHTKEGKLIYSYKVSQDSNSHTIYGATYIGGGYIYVGTSSSSAKGTIIKEASDCRSIEAVSKDSNKSLGTESIYWYSNDALVFHAIGTATGEYMSVKTGLLYKKEKTLTYTSTITPVKFELGYEDVKITDTSLSCSLIENLDTSTKITFAPINTNAREMFIDLVPNKKVAQTNIITMTGE